ncbi:MAG: zinc finger domain-containing protein [Methanomicrobiales archaeon]|nr:zinc finger domain-containing protein [Methanomicrobiales archaeon]
MEIRKCTSCNAPLAEIGATEFPCPEDGTLIRRCARCRQQSLAYTCATCGFRGP